MKIGQSKLALMTTILAICVKHQKTYCWPTRKKLKILLKKYYQVDISLRAIDHHLKDLRDFGFIKSFKRTGRNKDGTMFNLPSNRQLSKKGVFYLVRSCVKVARWLIDWAKSGVCPVWAKKEKQTKPGRGEKDNGQFQIPKTLIPVLAGIGKDIIP